jgi:biopolymer transport protein ExbD
MLIITIPIQMHAVKLDMPRPNPNAPKTQPEVVELMIDFDGTITWNGAIVQDLDELKGYLAGAAMQSPQPEMHLRPHKLVDYNHVALVLAAAQRLGVRRMGFVGNEQYLRGVEQYLQ